MKQIRRSYKDTEIGILLVHIKCPHCEHEQIEMGLDEPGKTYIIDCRDCEEKFEMYFDVD